MNVVTVAVPVRNGALTLDGVLGAVQRQRLACELELLVCDSGSTDDSVAIAQRHGARVVQIAMREFSHGGTRNLLMNEARGQHVALLTQDAEPVDDRWLENLLGGFDLADDVALVYGPYRPRPDADRATASELRRWFVSLAPDGLPRVDRLTDEERRSPAVALYGRRSFFTDANACLSREAWERVPFRAVPYAEDHALALDMLRAGYAKVFAPDAGVWHSHRYSSLQRFRRSFDESRGLLEVYGWRTPADPRRAALALRGELRASWRELDAERAAPARRALTLVGQARHHVAALAGALSGSRADRLPERVRQWCSLEGRGGPVRRLEHPDLRPASTRE